MAIWQYTFFIIPKESIKSLNEALSHKDSDLFDDSVFWSKTRKNVNIFDPIGEFLEKRNAWSPNIILYGSEQSNCLEILKKSDFVVSASCRIDFSNNYDRVLSQLIDFFLLNGLSILDEELNIINLNSEIIKMVIETSPQIKKYKSLSSNE